MRRRERPGYTIIAVLIVVSVLSLAAYRFADAMTSEYAVAVRSSESAQSKTFAASGVHKAMGMLADPDTLNNQLAGNPYDNPQAFSNQSLTGFDQSRGGGRFSLITVGDTYNGSGESRYQQRYGVSDESAKLNVNALIQLDPSGNVLHDALMKLPNMTEDIADAIVDWVDSDDTMRDAGAETAYYAGLPQIYKAKNGPLSSLDELLLVKGVTPYLLFGNDRNRNGKLDPGEADGNDYSRGWSEYLTVYGRELDADANGNVRINLNPTDPATDPVQYMADLTAVLGPEMANYIVYYKMNGATTQLSTTPGSTATPATGMTASPMAGSTTSPTTATTGAAATSQKAAAQALVVKVGSTNSATPAATTVVGTPEQLATAVQTMMASGKMGTKKVTSFFTLMNTQATLPKAKDAPKDAPTVVVACPLNDPAKLAELLPKLLDMTTTRTGFEIAPRVNVNTAPPEVLLALPGLVQADVDAIVAGRANLTPTDPATTTGAWIVTQAGVKPETFRSLEKYVTGRTMTYRVQSVGYFGQGGPVARVEAVIDTNQGHPRILYFRDLTDLGRGFDLPR